MRERVGKLIFDDDGGTRTVTLWSDAGKWRWELARETRENVPRALRQTTWTGPSREWATVTPMVLHHHPKKRAGHAEQIVADALATAQYPEAEWIRLSQVSVFEGVGGAAELPLFTQGAEGLCRYQTHVVIRFRELVEGPVLVGRGRYRGYGLLAPYAGAVT